jgi:hypothetical protein
MTTVSQGSSATVDIAIGQKLSVSTAGEAYVDIVAGPTGAGYTSKRITASAQTFGPYGMATRVNVRAVSGDATYSNAYDTAAAQLAYDAAGNVAGIQGAGGMPISLELPNSAVAKLKRRILGGLLPLNVMATPPTITQIGPDAGNNTQGTSIGSGVTIYAQDVVAGTDKRFSILNSTALPVVGTANNGIKFYYGPNGGSTDTAPAIVIGFYTDAPIVEIGNRRSDIWQVMVDGQLVSPTVLTANAGTSFGLTRTVLNFGSRARRKIMAYGVTSGFFGIGIGSQDTIEPMDFASEIVISHMSDSYGGTSSGIFSGGLFWHASMLLGGFGFRNSPGGGSGYNTPGTGGQNFLTRLPILIGQKPDVLLTAGGINDANPITNCAAYYQAARAALPGALLVAVGPWTPNAGSQGAGPAKRDSIYSALSAVAGPWIMVDNVAGTWSARATSGAMTSGSVGNPPWQTGNGNTGALTGVGNGDFYVGDGVHPNGPGTIYLGQLLATAIRHAVITMPS